ncbi:MAG TPA: ribose ABC transporter permease [Verrucomicrobia bacterium]|nr:ribose ABC transporter permease [Verrucomicrobiota bacterium]
MKTHGIDMERFGPFIALLVLFVAASLTSEYFLQVTNLLNILRQVSYTGIIALGMTFVIIAGGIDLSVGSMTALVGGLTILALNHFGPGAGAVVAGISIALLLGMAGGAVNGLIVTVGRVAPFIATLGTMAIFRSLTLWTIDAGEFRSNSELYGDFGMGLLWAVPVPVWILLVLTVLFSVLLNNTPFGRYVCAVGSNERVARYSAIRVKFIRFVCYVILGLTVGISAVLLSARMNSVSSSGTGLNFELDAIAAVIIGGTSLSGGRGSIIGTLVGAVILGIVNNMLNMWGISPYLQGTVKGAVILGAVLIQRTNRSWNE